jgi:hypothetical protein
VGKGRSAFRSSSDLIPFPGEERIDVRPVKILLSSGGGNPKLSNAGSPSDRFLSKEAPLLDSAESTFSTPGVPVV